MVTLWRDSVAMGDDMDAPHEWILSLPANAPIAEVVEQIERKKYLPQIAGGQASWILEGDQPLAVIAQQWKEPRWLVGQGVPVEQVYRKAGDPHLNLRYWCQADPEEVFEALQSGKTLPSRNNT
jgi:hypothetical protein